MPHCWQAGILVASLLAGCATTVHTTIERPQLAPAGVSLLAVRPIKLLYEHDQAEQLVKTHMVLDELLAAAPVVLACPWEFRQLSTAGEPLRRTDLLLLLQREGWRPDQTALIEVRLERRVATGGARMETANGRLAGRGGSYQAEVQATVTLESLLQGEPFMEWTTTMQEDPFAARPEHDPHPAFRAALRQVLEGALAWLDHHHQGVSPPASAHRWWRATLHDVLAAPPAADPATVAGLQAALARIGYLQPDITIEALTRLAKQPPGVCLEEAPTEGRFACGRTPGQCIQSLEGHPLRHPASLIRMLLAPSPRGMS